MIQQLCSLKDKHMKTMSHLFIYNLFWLYKMIKSDYLSKIEGNSRAYDKVMKYNNSGDTCNVVTFCKLKNVISYKK